MGETLRTLVARRLGLLLAGMLAVLGVGAVTAQAASPVQVQLTEPVQTFFMSPSIPNPCNGELITWTGNVHVLGVMTTDAAGGLVLTADVNLEGVHGTDPTGTRYTVTLASHEEVVLAPSSPNLGSLPNIVTHAIRLNINSAGSTPNAFEDGVSHFTILPDGTVTVSFDKVDTGCTR